MSLKDQLNDYPFAEYRCLDFISGLYAPCSNDEQQEGVRRLFRCGYCWYFAHMMQTAFHGEGTVCFAYPFGHWVWCSNNGTPYDIEGVYTGEAELLIPEYFCKEIIPAFTHNDDDDDSIYDFNPKSLLPTIKKVYDTLPMWFLNTTQELRENFYREHRSEVLAMQYVQKPAVYASDPIYEKHIHNILSHV